MGARCDDKLGVLAWAEATEGSRRGRDREYSPSIFCFVFALQTLCESMYGQGRVCIAGQDEWAKRTATRRLAPSWTPFSSSSPLSERSALLFPKMSRASPLAGTSEDLLPLGGASSVTSPRSGLPGRRVRGSSPLDRGARGSTTQPDGLQTSSRSRPFARARWHALGSVPAQRESHGPCKVIHHNLRPSKDVLARPIRSACDRTTGTLTDAPCSHVFWSFSPTLSAIRNARMTYYYTDVGPGACGQVHQNNEYTVAMNTARQSPRPSPVFCLS